MADWLDDIRAMVTADRLMNKLRYGCACRLSDAWRCAVNQNLRTVACHCRCHRPRATVDRGAS